MDNYDLTHLERQIEYILDSRDKLKAENVFLRQKLIKLTQERADLLDKNKRAAVKIKHVISQLRNKLQ